MEEDFSKLATSIYKIKTEKNINNKLEIIEGAGFFMQIDEFFSLLKNVLLQAIIL